MKFIFFVGLITGISIGGLLFCIIDNLKDVSQQYVSARDSARAIENILVEDLPKFKEKYPNGTFKNIIPLWEKGLYPVGIIDGKFVIYVPPVKLEFPVIK
jgi:hypothetical protein